MQRLGQKGADTISLAVQPNILIVKSGDDYGWNFLILAAEIPHKVGAREFRHMHIDHQTFRDFDADRINEFAYRTVSLDLERCGAQKTG